MPMVTIVNLEDEDGYEFPVALSGDWSREAADDTKDAAMERAKQFIESGDFRPTGELHVTGIEFPNRPGQVE